MAKHKSRRSKLDPVKFTNIKTSRGLNKLNSVWDESSALQMKQSQNTMEGSQYDPAEALKVIDNFNTNNTAQQLMIEMNHYSGLNPLALQNIDDGE